jgi:hypothetical protein
MTEKQIEVKDEDGRPAGTRKLMDVVLKGGPLTRGKDFVFTVDGEAPKHTTRVELVADVGDVMRLKTEQILVFADVETKVAAWEKTTVADVRIHGGEESEQVKVAGRGPTPLDALRDALRQLEEQA